MNLRLSSNKDISDESEKPTLGEAEEVPSQDESPSVGSKKKKKTAKI